MLAFFSKPNIQYSKYFYVFIFHRYNPENGKLDMSYSLFKTSDLHPLGKFILSVFSVLRLVKVQQEVREERGYTCVNNLTLLNFIIKMVGPLHERTLMLIILGIQVQ